jgi:cytidine deaminase
MQLAEIAAKHNISESTLLETLEASKRASKLAYAPYSKYHVGAGLMTTNGRIYEGCNVENASYGLAICAERTAIVKAVSCGDHSFNLMAIYAYSALLMMIIL